MFVPDLFALPSLDLLGLVGAAIYCAGYLLTVFDRIPSASPVYYLMRIVAACLVLTSLAGAFNLAAATIQVFFIVASVVGFVRHRRNPIGGVVPR